MIGRHDAATTSTSDNRPCRIRPDAWCVALDAALPERTGYVTDLASVLDAGTEAALTARLREVEQQTTAEIAVATVATLDNMSVDEYANRLFR
jgi:uncharacterized protein